MGDGEHTARVFITCPCGKRCNDSLLDEFPRPVGNTLLSIRHVLCSGDGSGNASRAFLSNISEAYQQMWLSLYALVFVPLQTHSVDRTVAHRLTPRQSTDHRNRSVQLQNDLYRSALASPSYGRNDVLAQTHPC